MISICRNDELNKVDEGISNSYPRKCPKCTFGPCLSNIKVDGPSSKEAYQTLNDFNCSADETVKSSFLEDLILTLCGPNTPLPQSYYEKEGITLRDLQKIRFSRHLSKAEQKNLTEKAKNLLNFLKVNKDKVNAL